MAPSEIGMRMPKQKNALDSTQAQLHGTSTSTARPLMSALGLPSPDLPLPPTSRLRPVENTMPATPKSTSNSFGPWKADIRRPSCSLPSISEFLSIQPPHTPIPCAADLESGSRKANAKRLKNRGYSQDLRNRKNHLEQLEKQIQKQAEEIEELKKEKKFYQDKCELYRKLYSKIAGFSAPFRPPSVPLIASTTTTWNIASSMNILKVEILRLMFHPIPITNIPAYAKHHRGNVLGVATGPHELSLCLAG